MSSMPGMPAETVATQVTVVESEACHFCDDARHALGGLAAIYPLSIRTVSVRGDEGAALMRLHRAALSPLVLIDGAFFSHGRLPRRKLEKILRQTYGDRDTTGSDSLPGRRHG